MNNQELEVIEFKEKEKTQANEKIEFIEDSNVLKEGMFALLKKAHRDLHYDVGVALLIQELKFADNNLHSVFVRHHPNYSNNTVGFLHDEFYQHFKVITQAEGEEIRKHEIEELQKLITHKEKDLQEYRDNPQKLQTLALSIYSKRIGSPSTPQVIQTNNIANLLGQTNALEQVNLLKSQANMFADVAKIQADIINEKVNELQTLMKKLTPYMVERYATTLASTKEAQDTIKEVNDGIATLSLYTGEGVEVYEIKQGVEAPQHIPLTLVQDKILCDVELAYFNDVSSSYLDVNNVYDQFFNVLADNPKLIDQIFPTERCICVAAVRESYIDYKDRFWNIVMNKLNKETFLLVRNGDNISVVYSPISTHLAANNLFPSKDILDKCFLTRDEEMDINIDNLKYSDALSEIDRITLHYKRFLILIAGLQHRLNLFGRFYPDNESFEIFFPHFQNKYFNFIHDQDGSGMLGDIKELSLNGYIAQQNSKLAKGSTLICRTYEMVTEDAAPYCWTYSWRRGSSADSLTRRPDNSYEITTVEQDKDGLFVRFPVNSGYTERSALAKVRIEEDSSEFNYLVLDNLSIERLENYISKRKYRRSYLSYIGLFKGAKAYLEQFEKDNTKDFNFYVDAVQQIKDHDKSSFEIKEIVMCLINFFKARIDQATILNFLHQMLSMSKLIQLKELLGHIEFFKDDHLLIGSKAIAITVDRSGNQYIYVSLPKGSEISVLSNIEEDYWVYRCSLKSLKRKSISLDKAEIVSLLDNVRDELVLNVIDDDLYQYYYENGATLRQTRISGGVGQMTYKKLFSSYQNKLKFLENMEFSRKFISALFSNRLTKDLVYSLQAKIRSRRLDFENAEGDFHDRNLKELTLCLPYVIFNRGKVGSICLKNGINWLDDLAERYSKSDAELINQNNLSQIIGVISTNSDFNSSDRLFTRALDITRNWDSFSTMNALSSQYEYSTKLLSYVIHSSAKKLMKEDHFHSPSLMEVKNSIKYCIFDEDALVTFKPSIDAEIENPHLQDSLLEIKAYRFEEVVKKGSETVSRRKHFYIGAEPYLSEYLENVKTEINDGFSKLSGNLSGEICREGYENDYICSTGDFEVFRKYTLSSRYDNNGEDEYIQINDHIFKMVKDAK
ncbi:coiled-coil domain-containing protein [Acinetobacter baumannii]